MRNLWSCTSCSAVRAPLETLLVALGGASGSASLACFPREPHGGSGAAQSRAWGGGIPPGDGEQPPLPTPPGFSFSPRLPRGHGRCSSHTWAPGLILSFKFVISEPFPPPRSAGRAGAALRDEPRSPLLPFQGGPLSKPSRFSSQSRFVAGFVAELRPPLLFCGRHAAAPGPGVHLWCRDVFIRAPGMSPCPQSVAVCPPNTSQGSAGTSAAQGGMGHSLVNIVTPSLGCYSESSLN